MLEGLEIIKSLGDEDLFHIGLAIISIITCYFIGDWRNWKRYNSTILFYIAGDLIYNVVTYNKPLWQYVSAAGHILSNILIAAVVFPCTVLVLIPYYPKQGMSQKIFYISFWVVLQSSVERISHYLGYFTYHNGWGLRWSIMANIILFPTMIIHQHKPLRAYIIFIITAMTISVIFGITLADLK